MAKIKNAGFIKKDGKPRTKKEEELIEINESAKIEVDKLLSKMVKALDHDISCTKRGERAIERFKLLNEINNTLIKEDNKNPF